MTTTPLPPTKHDHPDAHTMIWTQSELVWIQNRDAQWQAYAIQARADLEAENQRLREALTLTFSYLVEHIDRWDEELITCKKMVKVALESKP